MIQSEAYKKVWLGRKLHPDWEVNCKYTYIAGFEYRNKNCELTPCEIVRQFMSTDKAGTLNQLYNLCKNGLGNLDYMNYQSIGPFDCLEVWHISRQGDPGYKVEVVLDTRSRELSVYQTKGE